jgi:DNA-directed RNA polymerase specialized sigma24 family protein
VGVFSDRAAFEALCERNEACIFNFCLRVVGLREAATAATEAAFREVWGEPGTREGRDREIRLLLLTAAHRQIAGLNESRGGDDVAASSPLPVSEANGRLAVRDREVVALRDLVGCSYEEIAGIVGADRQVVAERLWRARLELRDHLTTSRLLSIVPVDSPCRHALALIVMALDDELRDHGERDSLQRHLRTCGKCRMSQAAAREASVAYRAWRPAAIPTGIRESLLDTAGTAFATALAGWREAGSGMSTRSQPCSPPPASPHDARRSPG